MKGVWRPCRLGWRGSERAWSRSFWVASRYRERKIEWRGMMNDIGARAGGDIRSSSGVVCRGSLPSATASRGLVVCGQDKGSSGW
jgi:hypothetical protein